MITPKISLRLPSRRASFGRFQKKGLRWADCGGNARWIARRVQSSCGRPQAVPVRQPGAASKPAKGSSERNLPTARLLTSITAIKESVWLSLSSFEIWIRYVLTFENLTLRRLNAKS